LRDDLMSVDDVQDRFTAMRKVVVNNLFSNYISTEQAEEDWDVEGLYHALKSDYAADFPLQEWLDEGLDVDELVSRIDQGLVQIFEYKEKVVGSEQMRGFEKAVMLQTLDHFWKEHLAAMDYLRQSISLRGYAQKRGHCVLLFRQYADKFVYCRWFRCVWLPLQAGCVLLKECCALRIQARIFHHVYNATRHNRH
jgi:preprotein translocase subunit SecA